MKININRCKKNINNWINVNKNGIKQINDYQILDFLMSWQSDWFWSHKGIPLGLVVIKLFFVWIVHDVLCSVALLDVEVEFFFFLFPTFDHWYNISIIFDFIWFVHNLIINHSYWTMLLIYATCLWSLDRKSWVMFL